VDCDSCEACFEAGNDMYSLHQTVRDARARGWIVRGYGCDGEGVEFMAKIDGDYCPDCMPQTVVDKEVVA